MRPIRHRLADRVRAHLFLRMLSYYISWHMKPPSRRSYLSTTTNSPRPPNAPIPSPPPNAQIPHLPRPPANAVPKDYPVHSYTSLPADLATICANQIQPTNDMPAFTLITTPTPPQQNAFELLGVSHRHGLT